MQRWQAVGNTVSNLNSRESNPGPPIQWRSKGGGIFDKLLGYIAHLLIVNHLAVLPSAQAQSCGNGPRHLVYALVYSREYNKDLILMCIMSQLSTVFFFVFALFQPPFTYFCQASAFRHKLRKCFCIVYSDCQWRSTGEGGFGGFYNPPLH